MGSRRLLRIRTNDQDLVADGEQFYAQEPQYGRFPFVNEDDWCGEFVSTTQRMIESRREKSLSEAVEGTTRHRSGEDREAQGAS